MNTLKTMVLMTLLTIMLIGIGAILGGKSGMTMALLLAFGMNFISYWFSDKIVLKMTGARQITETEAPELFNMVNRLALSASLPMPKVYIIDEDQPNAFATGRNPENGVVAVTSGIMRILSREELEGVIGHELAHIKNRDILVSTMVATIAGAITYLAQMAQWSMLFGGRRDDGEEGGSLFATFIMMIVGPIAAMLVQMAVSRSREYGADEGGGQNCRESKGPGQCFKKDGKGRPADPHGGQPGNSPDVYCQSPFRRRFIKAFQHPPAYGTKDCQT